MADAREPVPLGRALVAVVTSAALAGLVVACLPDGVRATAALPVALASLGAWTLAASLGLAARPASFAAIGYGLSACSLNWLGEPRGIVAASLPWLLVGLERSRHAPRLAGRLVAFVAALATWRAGDPASATLVTLAAGAWSVHLGTTDRRAAWWGIGLLVGAAVVAVALRWPSVVDGAAGEASAASLRDVDWLALGAILIAIGAVSRMKQLRGGEPSAWWLGALVVAFAFVLSRRGLGGEAVVALWPDFFGRPRDLGGYGGPGTYAELSAAWFALPVLTLATAACFAPRAVLPRNAMLPWIGALALALAWKVPGVADLWRIAPGIGRIAPEAAAPVAALCLALAAAHALAGSPSWARRGALIAVVCSALLATQFGDERPRAARGVPLDPPSELFEFTDLPPARVAGGEVRVAGSAHPGVPITTLELVVVPLEAAGDVDAGPNFRLTLDTTRDPRGWNAFDSGPLAVAALEQGEHLFALRITADDGRREVVTERLVAHTLVARTRGMTALSLLFLLATALLAWRRTTPVVQAALVALVLAQGVWFACG